jgi:predicted peroxiredoxin
MAEKEEHVLFICTHAEDHLEKAAVPFVMANGAMAMDVKATIVLQGDGVYLAKKGIYRKPFKAGRF